MVRNSRQKDGAWGLLRSPPGKQRGPILCRWWDTESLAQGGRQTAKVLLAVAYASMLVEGNRLTGVGNHIGWVGVGGGGWYVQWG